jgi:hypothetical protein
VTKRDELIRPLVDHGLDAIEVYHSDHRPDDVQQYRGLAQRFGVLVSGGSDFHGDPSTSPPAHAAAGAPAVPSAPRSGVAPRSQRNTLGAILLPPEDFAALERRAAERRRPS